jgi:hypothetical protein
MGFIPPNPPLPPPEDHPDRERVYAAALMDYRMFLEGSKNRLPGLVRKAGGYMRRKFGRL